MADCCYLQSQTSNEWTGPDEQTGFQWIKHVRQGRQCLDTLIVRIVLPDQSHSNNRSHSEALHVRLAGDYRRKSCKKFQPCLATWASNLIELILFSTIRFLFHSILSFALSLETFGWVQSQKFWVWFTKPTGSEGQSRSEVWLLFSVLATLVACWWQFESHPDFDLPNSPTKFVRKQGVFSCTPTCSSLGQHNSAFSKQHIGFIGDFAGDHLENFADRSPGYRTLNCIF